MNIIAGTFARSATLLTVLLAITAQGRLAGQEPATPSQELRRLYEADQADRRFSSPPSPEEWAQISARDGVRRARVHELLRADLVVMPEDLYHAAMVLQHGEGEQDVLLAHILSTAAAFQGHEEARWLSAAALDRYLHRTEQPQRLGTQYVRVRPDEPFRIDPSAPWSQGVYESWLPDSIRAAFDVESLAEQAARVERMNEGS